MRKTTIALATVAAMGLASPAVAASSDTRAEVIAAYEAINDAFERQDLEAIDALRTSDHVSVSSNRNAKPDVTERLARTPLENFKRTPTSEIVVEEIAPGVAVQRFHAAMEGTRNGRPVPSDVVITIIWQQQEDGRWLERLYQHSPLRG